MTNKLANRVKVTVSGTPGTGSITLGSALPGFQTFAAGGVSNSDTVPYVIEDGSAWEIGVGTYSSTGPTLARTTITSSSNSGSAITASSSSVVMLSPLAADLQSGTSAGNLVELDSSARIPAVDGSLITNLNVGNAASGTLSVARGGTGLTSLTAGQIPFGAGTSAFGSSSGLTTDGTNLTVSGGVATNGDIISNSGNINLTNSATSSNLAFNWYPGSNVARIAEFVVYPTNSSASTVPVVKMRMGSTNLTAGSERGFYSLRLTNGTASDALYYNIDASSDVQTWSTSNTERLRLSSAGNLSIGTSTNNVFDQVAAARPLVVQSASTSTTVGASTNSITLVNSDTTTSNSSQINFAAITGASANQYTGALISCIYGARTNTQYPAGQLVFATSAANSAPTERLRIDSSGNVGIGTNSPSERLSVSGAIGATTTIRSSGATSGIGYATGAGGTVTQATSRTTVVTIDKVCGQITLVSAAGSTAWQSFTVTNSAVASTDTIIVNQDTGTDLYQIFVTNVAAGSFRITFATTGGTTTEQPVFGFSVIKAVAA